MLGKKIRRLLITIISTVIITFSLMTTLHSGTWNKFTPNNQIEYKVDMTEYKIKQVINTNKLQTYEVEFTVSLNDSEYDKSGIKWLNELSKTLTTRKLVVSNDYKALFTYDLSKANIVKNLDGTYTITINSKDVETNIVSLKEADVKESMSLIGRYYSSQDTTRVINELNERAKKQVYTQENINTTVNNAVNNLTNLFKSVEVDTSKVYFVKQFSGMGVNDK